MQLNTPFAALTPTLDGDVLAVLAGAPDATFTVSQVQRIIATASGEGIRKVLTRLTTQGVVLHDIVGRTNSYRLNTEHLAAGPILALAQLSNEFLDRLRVHLDEWGDELTYAAVFGSAATGRMTLDSDIDLLLVRGSHSENPNRWEERVVELGRLVTAWTGNDGRVVEYTEADLRAAATRNEPLLRDIAAHGLTVAGQPSWLKEQLLGEDVAAKKRSC